MGLSSCNHLPVGTLVTVRWGFPSPVLPLSSQLHLQGSSSKHSYGDQRRASHIGTSAIIHLQRLLTMSPLLASLGPGSLGLSRFSSCASFLHIFKMTFKFYNSALFLHFILNNFTHVCNEICSYLFLFPPPAPPVSPPKRLPHAI